MMIKLSYATEVLYNIGYTFILCKDEKAFVSEDREGKFCCVKF